MAVDIAAAIDVEETQAGLTHCAVEAAQMMGFDNVSLARLHRAEVRLIAGAPHQAWSKYLYSNGCLLDVPAYLLRTFSGLKFYSELEHSPRTPGRIAEIAAARRQFGLKDGFITVRRINEDLAYFVSFIGEDPDSADPDCRAAAHVLASHLLTAAVRIDANEPTAGRTALMTDRQLECLRWAREGKSSSDIGAILKISPNTVNEHLAQACSRLGVRTRIQAVTRASELGLFSQANPVIQCG